MKWLLVFMLCSSPVLAAHTPEETVRVYQIVMQQQSCSHITDFVNEHREAFVTLTDMLQIGWFARTKRPINEKELVEAARVCGHFPNWTYDEVLDAMARR